jgi:hypothetical protein
MQQRIQNILKQTVNKSFSAGEKVVTFTFSKTVPFIIGIVATAISFALAPYFGPIAAYIGFIAAAASVMWYSSRKNDEVYTQLKESNDANDKMLRDLRSNAQGNAVLLQASEVSRNIARTSSSIDSYKTILYAHKVGDLISTAGLGVGTYLQSRTDKIDKYLGSGIGAAGIIFAGATHILLAHSLRGASNKEAHRKEILTEMRTLQRIEIAKDEVHQSLTM